MFTNIRGLGIKGFASGGLATGLSFAGEKGPEWIIPTYEPEKTKFMRDMGFNMTILGKEIASQLNASLALSTPGEVKNVNIERPTVTSPQPIIVKIDEEAIGRAFAKNMVIPESVNGEVHVHVHIGNKEFENLAVDAVTTTLENGNNRRLNAGVKKRSNSLA